MWFYNHISIIVILLYMQLIYSETLIPKHSWKQLSFPKST